MIGLFKLKQLSPALKFIEWFVLSSVISGWIEQILASNHIHNLWLFHFNTMLELFLVLVAFSHWRTSQWNGKLIYWSFVFYLICWIVGKFTIEPLTRSDEYTGIIAKLIQIGCSVWLLLNVLTDSTTAWKIDPRLWVASGIIFYNVSTLFLFGLFGVLLVQSKATLKILWNINWYAIIVSYSFYLRAFFCSPVSAGIINTSQPIHKE